MRKSMHLAAAALLVAAGYCLGTWHADAPRFVAAQDAPEDPLPSDASVEKIKGAGEALLAAQQQLIQDGRYKPVVDGLNPYAVLVGGVDALDDLKKNRGVDPMTFAMIYAGLHNDTIAADVKEDKDGRKLYGGKVIRMYSIERMKRLAAMQKRISDKKIFKSQ